MRRIRFLPNVPQLVSLKESEPKPIDHRWNKFSFLVADGREMHVTPAMCTTIKMMDLKPGETFSVCMHWNGEKNQPKRWNVWLSPETEKARAAVERSTVEEPDSDLLGQLRQSIARKLEDAGVTRLHIGQSSQGGRRSADLVGSESPKSKDATPNSGPEIELVGSNGVRAPQAGPKVIPMKLGLEEAMERFLLMAGRAVHRAEGTLGNEGAGVRFDSRDVAALATTALIHAERVGWIIWK